MAIGRTAELCHEPVGVQPCPHCGSTAAIINLDGAGAADVRRMCCHVGGFWRSPAGRAWFAGHGVDVTAAASRLEVRHG